MNTHVGHIARWPARLRGFVGSPSPPPTTSETSEDDDDFNNEDDDEDGDANSFGTDEMST